MAQRERKKDRAMSMLKPIATASLAEIAFSRLVEAISAGEFEPGQRLSEADLARRFGISRGPLREALQRLEGRLVTRRARVGVHVIELSEQAIRELFMIREALEGMAARQAAENARTSDIAALRSLLSRHAKDPALKAGAAYRQGTLDNDFHATIVRLAGNRRLEDMLVDNLYYQLRLYRYRSSAKSGRALVAFDEHVAIVDAIESGDPAAAEDAMRVHIHNAHVSLAQQPRPKGTTARAQNSVPST
ncbi:GntR family transcriptional regulator [Rhodoplanes sp. Z2-YC6860]|uniref:GntR family transcriptional regulator n=1 Tax=Rhodoplanes sp. Z2-YC6860 TaxID=674703 RepID=UPI00078EA3C5|nr:GntR family transcriptional regulator [Rhodoplanes sp. Z2-YC6860]AMN44040.1 GntR family transcriptional regulator [Rhodoplanes sp. Z2-YC6860]